MSKGVGVNMLKSGIKRRRTKAQIAEEEQEEFIRAERAKSALEELAIMNERVR